MAQDELISYVHNYVERRIADLRKEFEGMMDGQTPARIDVFERQQRERLEIETAKRQARVDEEALTGDPIGDAIQRGIQRAREIKGDA